MPLLYLDLNHYASPSRIVKVKVIKLNVGDTEIQDLLLPLQYVVKHQTIYMSHATVVVVVVVGHVGQILECIR